VCGVCVWCVCVYNQGWTDDSKFPVIKCWLLIVHWHLPPPLYWRNDLFIFANYYIDI